MQNTSFLEIMRVLNKEELKRFDSFLNSPYFNTRSNVIKLFVVIKKYAPDFRDSSLDKEEIWKKISPGKEYNYGILKNIIYDITKLAERFLETEGLIENEPQRMKNLLIKLGDKHLENIFMNKYNSFEKNYFKSSKFHNEYYSDYIDLKESRFLMQAFDPKLRSKLISTDISEMLIFDFIAKFSVNYNNMYIEKTEYNELPENDFIKMFSEKVFKDTELEEYAVKLTQVPADVDKIVVTVTIHDAAARSQNFGQVANAFIRVVNEETGTEVVRFDLAEDYSVETAMVFGEVYRHNGEWKFRAVGQGYSGGLQAMCQQYGVDI